MFSDEAGCGKDLQAKSRGKPSVLVGASLDYTEVGKTECSLP